MPRYRVYVYSLVLCLLGGLAASAQQNPVKITRQPIAVDATFFTTLNSKPKHLAFNKLSSSTNAAAQVQSPRIVSLPSFTRSFTFGGQVFPYTMVGKDPARKQTTTIPTQYIPMSFFFDEFVDQNGNNIVIDTTVINDEIEDSPLFENSQFATGFTQYEDAVMRAEFFPLFSKDRDNDGNDSYHVLLGRPKTLIPVTIEVPPGSSVVLQAPDGNLLAIVDINFIVSQLNTLVQTEPITVNAIPMFVTRNALYGDFVKQQPVSCCIGGFHTAFESNQVGNNIFVQTFDFATSLDADIADFAFGDPTIFADIFPLSHELGETLNDPFVNNATPSYQIPGAPAGVCQSNLEVGDIIENLANPTQPITLHGFTYHPQTLALLQWFEGKTPSDAINGDYSFPDAMALTSPFMACPPPPPPAK
jgi:hypothetical protein